MLSLEESVVGRGVPPSPSSPNILVVLSDIIWPTDYGLDEAIDDVSKVKGSTLSSRRSSGRPVAIKVQSDRVEGGRAERSSDSRAQHAT